MICHQSDGAGFFVSFPPVTTMWWGRLSRRTTVEFFSFCIPSFLHPSPSHFPILRANPSEGATL